MSIFKNKLIGFVLLLGILSSFSNIDFFSKRTYVYKDITGKISSKTTWLIKKKSENFVMDKNAEDGRTNLIYSDKFLLKEFSYKSLDTKLDFTITLDNKVLTAHGVSRGNKINKKLGIDYDWIQDFNFGLRNFLESKYTQKRFVIFRSKDFSTIDMLAFKKGIEKLIINNVTYNAQKVEITLTGFKSRFWKAHIWYDLKNFDLLKYQANEGPGTPLTTISLFSKD